MIALSELKVGTKYRIVYKSSAQKFNRESVMTYIGRHVNSLDFSARPVLGTQIIPVEWLVDLVAVDQATVPYVGRRAQ